MQLIAIINRDHPKITCDLYDANAIREDNVVAGQMGRLTVEVTDKNYDVVMIGGLITSYNYVKSAVKTIRDISRDTKIIVGGGILTSIPHDMMRLLPEIDYGVMGEAYISLPNLLMQIGGDERTVKGIVIRDKTAGLYTTDPQPLIPDLDWLPFPSYGYAPLNIYFKNSSILMSEESMNARRRLDACFSLGCPFPCGYCWDLGLTSNVTRVGRPAGATLHRRNSPKYIAEYINRLQVGFNVDFVSWLDENVVAQDVLSKDMWLREIEIYLSERNLLPTQKYPVYHGGTAHPGLIKRETLKTLKRIGFTYLDYGLESFSAKILKDLGKGTTPQKNKEAVQMTLEEGIQPIPNQMIMFPGETFETLGEMLDAWEEVGIVSKPFIVTPYPGSEWFNKYKPRIMAQYGNDLNKFLMDLGDATAVSALLTDNFTPAEAVGIQNIMADGARTGNFSRARRLLALSNRSGS